MRKVIVALVSTVVVGMLMVPGSASAKIFTDETTALDSVGDVPFMWDSQTGDKMLEPLNSNRPLYETGYLDMKSYWLSQYVDTELGINMYTFGMELAAELPTSQDEMPQGIKRVEWVMYIDLDPWNPVLNPDAECLFMLNLTFDGEVYDAFLVDYVLITGPVIAHLDWEVTGSTFWIQLPANLIGDLQSFWWEAATRVWWGGPDTYGMRLTDMTDWNVADGQEWYDIPWESLWPDEL